MTNYDKPKKSVIEDELGYSYLSYYFAKIIKEAQTKDGAYVIGLCGKWGDGKTTIINYVKEILSYSYQKNVNLEIEEYRNIIEDIKNNNKSDDTNKPSLKNIIAIIGTVVAFLMVLIEVIFIFDLGLWLKNIDTIYLNLFFMSFLCLFAIPKARDFLGNLLKETFLGFLNLFEDKKQVLKSDIEFIEFNPWNYQKDEKSIIENFFKVLSSKIDISNKAKYKNMNALLRYASCLLDFDLEKVECEENISELKKYICEELKKGNKKYVVMIDDLDRIQPQEALVVFKAVKLLADFPNVIYFLAYDKEHLTNHQFLQNSNYIQKIIQLEKSVPVIPAAKLKEIFFKRIIQIIKNLGDADKAELIKVYDGAINKLIKNIRDINRFDNCFSLSFIANKNIKEIQIVDYVLISLLEEFDKKTYVLIQDNKELLFESISVLDLRKHVEFVQNIAKNSGFQIFMVLFAPYLSRLEEALNSIITIKTVTSQAQTKSDISQFDVTKTLEQFKFYYNKFLKNDSYRRICEKESFDNYFLTHSATSLVTDIEYKQLKEVILTPENFAKEFVDIFSKNEDKFKDFCERLSRDSFLVENAECMKSLVRGCLAINDEMLFGLFEVRDFCENILSILRIKKLFTKHEMLEILENSFSENNIIQQIYWYDELTMGNIDEYFKTQKYKKFELGGLKNKIKEAIIKDYNDFDLLLKILVKLKKCNVISTNFKDLTNKLLQNKKLVIELLKTCSSHNGYKFYFEFGEIKDILLEYYLNENKNYLGDRRFISDIAGKILDENLKNEVQTLKNKILMHTNSYAQLNGYIAQMKKIEECSNEQQKNALINVFKNTLETFKKQNIFSVIENLSKNELIIKYVLNICLMDEAVAKRLDSIVSACNLIIENLQTMNEKIVGDISLTIQLKNKYTEVINEMLSN